MNKTQFKNGRQKILMKKNKIPSKLYGKDESDGFNMLTCLP